MKQSKFLVFGCVLIILVIGLMTGSGCGSKGDDVQKVLNQVSPNADLNRIDLRSCPPDFQEAFIAWKAIEVPYLIDRNNSLSMVMHIGKSEDEIERNNEKSRAAKELKDAAWLKVETVALKYGAQKGM